MLTAYAAETSSVVSETGNELGNLFTLILTKIPLWIAAFVLIVVTVVIAKIARRIVENKMAEKGIEEDHKEVQIVGGRMTYAIVLTIGITVSLKIAGIDLTTIIAAGAFGIGFALKDLIMNFIAGIMILIGRHFTIGDYITIDGTLGKVVEIQSRVTIIQSVDGTKVIMPNAKLFSNKVVNLTGNPFRRIEVIASVDYRSNLDNALKVFMHVLKNTKGILANPAPAVLVSEYGDNEILIKLRGWVDAKSGWLKIKSNLMKNVKEIAYDSYNIAYCWPITQLVYDKEEKIEEKMFEEVAVTTDQNGNTTTEVVKVTEVAASEPTTAQTPQPLPQIRLHESGENDDIKPLKPLGEL